MLKKMISIVAVAGLVLALAPAAQADTYTWANPTIDGEWTDPANWTETTGDGYPNAPGDIANFYPETTPDDNPLEITVSGDVTVGQIRNAWGVGGVGDEGIALHGDGKIIWDNNGSEAVFDFDGTVNSFYNGIWVDMELSDDLRLVQNSWNKLTYGGTITEKSGESHSIIYDFVWQMYQGRWVEGSSPNTYSGGTIVRGGRQDREYAFTLNKNGAVGTGDLTLDITPGDEPDLRITDSGGVDNRIDDSASLYLEYEDNPNPDQDDWFTTVTLDANVNETIAALYFDGALQLAGTWGATGSLDKLGNPAANIDDDYFRGTGVLEVIPFVIIVPGDVDGDGDVDLADVGYFEAQFGMSGLPLPPEENSADLDADGDVDLDDLVFIRDNFGAGPAAPAAATPEPATMSLLALGGLMVLRRRRLRINRQQPTRNVQ